MPAGHLYVLFKEVSRSSAHFLIWMICCWVVWAVDIFWILSPCQSHCLQIFSLILAFCFIFLLCLFGCFCLVLLFSVFHNCRITYTQWNAPIFLKCMVGSGLTNAHSHVAHTRSIHGVLRHPLKFPLPLPSPLIWVPKQPSIFCNFPLS